MDTVYIDLERPSFADLLYYVLQADFLIDLRKLLFELPVLFGLHTELFLICNMGHLLLCLMATFL